MRGRWTPASEDGTKRGAETRTALGCGPDLFTPLPMAPRGIFGDAVGLGTPGRKPIAPRTSGLPTNLGEIVGDPNIEDYVYK